MGDLRHAGAFYREAVRLAPDNARALGNLGGLYVVTGRLDSALAVLRRAQSLGDAGAVVHFNLAVVQSRLGDLAAAESALLEAIALDSTYVRAYLQLAHMRAADGRHEEAIQVIEGAASVMPDDPLLRRELAKVLELGSPDAGSRPELGSGGPE
jgi:Flp pilus assembly protein TadD